jgi:hypothetical protein
VGGGYGQKCLKFAAIEKGIEKLTCSQSCPSRPAKRRIRETSGSAKHGCRTVTDLINRQALRVFAGGNDVASVGDEEGAVHGPDGPGRRQLVVSLQAM